MSIRLLTVIIVNNIKLEFSPDYLVQGEIVEKNFNNRDQHFVNNYRRITILSCLGKYLHMKLNAKLTHWTEEKYK